MIRVGFGVQPHPDEIRKRYSELGKGFGDMRPAFKELLTEVVAEHKKIVSTQGATLGEKWRPLKETYKKQKAKDKKAKKKEILQRTGKLVKTITTKKGKMSLTKKKLVFGVRGAHVRALYFGQSRGKGGIIARHFLGATASLKNKASKIFLERVEYLVEKANQKIAAQRKMAIFGGRK